jgi:hypothetical protein
VIKRKHRNVGNPYPKQRNKDGRFAPALRSLTLRDKIRRKYPHRVYASLSAKEHQQFKELAVLLNVAMSDIMAYLITNHLDQLAHQASFEAGQQSALDNIAANTPENTSI